MKINKTFINRLSQDPIGILNTLSLDDIVTLIQTANHEYYNKGKPFMSDQIYDVVRNFLQELSPSHPVLKHVGASVGQGHKVKLPFFMGSLDKIKNDEKVLMNWKHAHEGDYVTSDKLDGNSGLLLFKDGAFTLYSRGDGIQGQDISHLLPFLKTKASVDSFKKAGTLIAVRGELIISKKCFATIADKGANARNTVAGLVNAKVPDLQVVSLTAFVAYEVVFPAMTPVEQMKYMKDVLRLETVHSKVLKNKEFSMDALSTELTTRRQTSPYEIDGIVVSHNAIYPRSQENPEHSFAFKSVLTMEKAEVTVTKVEWNMSKDGFFVPVVHFTPVNLDGVTITRAHGFNGKFIRDNSIGPGATIIIMRSGAVIPYIVETLVKAYHPQMPESQYIWSKSGVDVMLDKHADDSKDKDTLQLRNVQYFFERIDVRGLSSGIVAKVYAHGLKTVGQILSASVDQFLEVEGFQQTLASKVHKAIEDRKQTLDAYTIMDASNVLGRGIGLKKIKLICDAFPAIIRENYIPTIAELTTLKGVEKKTAEVFVNNLPSLFEFVNFNKLALAEQVSSPPVTSPTTALRVAGKTFVFSGVRDKTFEEFLISNGGTVSNTVSGKTNLVLVKDLESQSSKVDKAKTLKVPIQVLQEFKDELGWR